MKPEKLKQIRKKAGLSQAKLGTLLGVKESTVSSWENGRRKISLTVELLIVKTFSEEFKNEESVSFATNETEKNGTHTSNTKINIHGHNLYVNDNKNDNIKKTITTSQQVYEYIKDIRDSDVETFWVISMDAKNNIISADMVGLGSVNECRIYPNVVFRRAIQNNAASILLCHNHPSGSPSPSTNDYRVTNNLKEVAEILGIRLLDHLVIGKNDYKSAL